MKKLVYLLLITCTLSACGYINGPSDNEAQERRLDYQQAQINALTASLQRNQAAVASLTRQLEQLMANNIADGQQLVELRALISSLQALIQQQQAQLTCLERERSERREALCNR